MSGLKLPRLISDGMVLQKKKKARIWGSDEPGRSITADFLDGQYCATADERGEWEIYLNEQEPGGPYTLRIRDDAGEEAAVGNILIGDVFVCSGQSNMDIPMARVRDRYPDEVIDCANPFIRTFKVMEHGEFQGPLKEHVSGEWWQAGPEHILDFSATAYFFAKNLYEMTGVPVGLIHASLGGSPIEAWLSADMIGGEAPYPEAADYAWDEASYRQMQDGYQASRQEYLELIARYSQAGFVEGQLRGNVAQSVQWHRNLDSLDRGLKEHWEQERLDDGDWERILLPCMFRDTPLSGFTGSLWLRRHFEIPDELVREGFAGEEKKLWLGTMVDSDTVYVNGIKVGHTDYQYPPRKYTIPAGLLHAGDNTIAIHLKCERGAGRVTPGKEYKIFDGVRAGRDVKPGPQREIRLEGEWSYRVGAVCGQVKDTDFVNFKPAALFNGMMAPNLEYTIGGFVWYQGESNTGAPANYLDSLKRMIGGYRKLWRDENLPFYLVQLPNFQIDLPPEGSGWREVREKQRLAQQIPGVWMAVAIDLGEDNDLHPLNKADVGKRLALCAAVDLYDRPVRCLGPEVEKITVKEDEEHGGWMAALDCRHAQGMYAYGAGKGESIADFELIDRAGRSYQAQAEIQGERIVLRSSLIRERPDAAGYCYHDTNAGALLYNDAGLPMSPFFLKLQ